MLASKYERITLWIKVKHHETERKKCNNLIRTEWKQNDKTNINNNNKIKKKSIGLDQWTGTNPDLDHLYVRKMWIVSQMWMMQTNQYIYIWIDMVNIKGKFGLNYSFLIISLFFLVSCVNRRHDTMIVQCNKGKKCTYSNICKKNKEKCL